MKNHPDTSKMSLQGNVYHDGEFYRYINPLGYEHCNHKNKKLVPIVLAWGNTYYICECGQMAKSKLTPTSL